MDCLCLFIFFSKSTKRDLHLLEPASVQSREVTRDRHRARQCWQTRKNGSSEKQQKHFVWLVLDEQKKTIFSINWDFLGAHTNFLKIRYHSNKLQSLNERTTSALPGCLLRCPSLATTEDSHSVFLLSRQFVQKHPPLDVINTRFLTARNWPTFLFCGRWRATGWIANK